MARIQAELQVVDQNFKMCDSYIKSEQQALNLKQAQIFELNFKTK